MEIYRFIKLSICAHIFMESTNLLVSTRTELEEMGRESNKSGLLSESSDVQARGPPSTVGAWPAAREGGICFHCLSFSSILQA